MRSIEEGPAEATASRPREPLPPSPPHRDPQPSSCLQKKEEAK